MPGAIDAALVKFHASLNVSNLDRSIAFYRALLGVEPAKVRTDYAKFDLAEPPLVLSLIPGRQPAAAGSLNHAGLRVRNAEELVAIQHRLEAAGMPTQREDGVECCYARQSKFWITDPDRTLWEIYVFHEDVGEEDDHHDHSDAIPAQIPKSSSGASTQSRRVWEHHLREPVPARIPHDDNSLHEVRLEGAINTEPAAENRAGLLAEALRALRPAGEIFLHGLSGDRSSRGRPSLTGPASAVQHVPATSDVLDEVTRAGFVDVRIEKLSETAYFVVDGVPMRELRVVARKPGHRPRAATHQAVYLGPMAQVVDDFGNVFKRGVPTPVNVHDWQVLSKGATSGSFLFMKTEQPIAEGCCGDQKG